VHHIFVSLDVVVANGLSYDFGVENVGDFSAVEIKLVKQKTNILQSEMPR